MPRVHVGRRVLPSAEDHGGPTVLDWRRLRRAEAHVTRAAAELAAQPIPHRVA